MGKSLSQQIAYKRWLALDWNSPIAPLPHGWSGSIVMVLGAWFLVQALWIGPNKTWGYDITGIQPRPLFYLFMMAVAVNTTAGLLLVKKKAAPIFHLPFYLGGAVQLSLAWFAVRFSLESTRQYSLLGSVLDKTFGFVLLSVVLISVYKILFSVPLQLQLPVLIGVLSMSLTFAYPFQLSWFGHEWFDCVLNRYPYQKSAFVAYIYVPTLVANACIFFGATLYARKILPEGISLAVFVVLVLGTLVSTVLAQEIHISQVSTQQLVLVCDDICLDGERHVLALAARMLDTSALAKTVLGFLGIPLNAPPDV